MRCSQAITSSIYPVTQTVDSAHNRRELAPVCLFVAFGKNLGQALLICFLVAIDFSAQGTQDVEHETHDHKVHADVEQSRRAQRQFS